MVSYMHTGTTKDSTTGSVTILLRKWSHEAHIPISGIHPLPWTSLPSTILARPVTWIMERHEDVVDRLHGAAPSLSHNVASLDFGSIDLLTHAARGVQDEAQAGGRADVQQSGEQAGDPGKSLHVCPQPLFTQVPQEHTSVKECISQRPLTWRNPCLPGGFSGDRRPRRRPEGPVLPPGGAA